MNKKLLSLLLVACMMISMLPAFKIDFTAYASEATTSSSESWEYSLNADGTATLTKYIGTDEDVYIPSTITDEKGVRISVTALGEGVFKNNTGINSATFGEGITTIGKSAFEGATNLVCIVSPETLTTIGDRAFYGCSAFNSVILYDAVTSIGADTFSECPNVTVWVNEGSYSHTYAESKGIAFDIINPDSSPQTYEVNGITYFIQNGEAYATAFDNSATEVVIPATIEGCPVTDIKDIFSQSAITSIVLPGTIKTIQSRAFYKTTMLESIEIPHGVEEIKSYAFSESGIKSVSIPDSVKNIGLAAFYFCDNLESLSIPGSINTFGIRCFGKCGNLKNVVIEAGVTKLADTMFSMCSSLESVVLPDTVTEIEVSAFVNCSSLSSITLPYSLRKIGASAFASCSSLSSIAIPSGVEEIGTGVFSATSLTSIPTLGKVTEIPANTFYNCQQLSEISIPEGILAIGERAFGNCQNLTNIIIPESVKSISANSFLGCKKLTKVLIPKSVVTLDISSFPASTTLEVYEGSYAHSFAKDNGLLFTLYNDGEDTTEIVEQDGLTYLIVGDQASITDCATSVTSISVPEKIKGVTVTHISENAFKGKTKITKVTLPDTITAIGDYAFYGCTSLATINLPTNLKNIGMQAFYNCKKIGTMTLPAGVTAIGDYAFRNCTGIKKITIPKSITTFGKGIFASCTLLSNVSFESGVTTVGANMFDGCSKLANISLPESITSIGSYAFRKTAIQEFAVPASVSSIETGTFENCTSLSKVTIPGSVKSIGANAFSNCSALSEVTLCEGIKNIGTSSFKNCNAIKTITLPRSLDNFLPLSETPAFSPKTIVFVYKDTRAFDYVNSNYMTVTLENGATNVWKGHGGVPYLIRTEDEVPTLIEQDGITYGIENDKAIALTYDSELSEVSIPEKVNGYPVTELRATFRAENSYGNSGTNITSVTIPDTVKVIGSGTFWGCVELYELSIPEGVTNIGNKAFAFCNATLDFPDSIEMIGDFPFLSTENIFPLNIPKNIISIGKEAFAVSDFESIVLPENLKKIDMRAFANSKNLKQVVIPKGVESIHASSFPSTAIWIVYENSYAHTYAEQNNLLYFVLRETSNPEIAYGSEISGTVTLDGVAASGAEVSLLYDDGVVKETVTTDESGAYSFTYAEVGAYTVRAKYAGTSGTEKVSVKRMNAFDVFLAGETDIVLKGAYTVSGTVSPTSATVTLTDTNGNIIETVATGNGSYSFANIPNGSYIVKAETANGTAVKEITVFNANVIVEEIVIDAVVSGIVTGTIYAEGRDGSTYKKVWATVTLRDDNGTVIAQTKSNENGVYSFEGVIPGNYSILAEAEEMRPDKFDAVVHNHKLSGCAYAEISSSDTYTFDITISEENYTGEASVSGKVTAQGETQPCKVVVADVSGNEIAKCQTGNNGKYTFVNLGDGVYFITATTPSEGMGFTVITVRDGKINGDTDIHVWKDDKVKDHEDAMETFMTGCTNAEIAKTKREWIAEEKRWYDGLSENAEKQCSDEYVNSLNTLCGWISECEASSNYSGATLSGEEQLLSGDELENDETYEFLLNIEESTATAIDEKEIKNEKQYKQKKLEQGAGDKSIVAYYDITLTKTDSDGNSYAITSVARDTDTTGKVRITMDIPEEHRGHKHYHFVHEHNGETTTLVDLDDNPDTITFEIDRFSTFALTYTDNQLAIDGDVEEEIEKKSIVLGSTMTLANSLTMSIYFNAAESEATDKVVVEHIFKDGRASEKIEKLVSECAPSDIGGNMYMIRIDTIAAKEMSDEIKVTVYNAEGIQKSVDYTTSVRAYAMKLFETTTDENLKKVVVNMLNYGAAAQDFFNYSEDDLANKLLTEEMMAYASEKVEVTTDTMIKGKNFAGTTLTLESNIILTGYFAKTDADISKLSAKASFTDHYGNAKTQDIGSDKFNMSLSGIGYFGVDVTEVVIADLKQPVTVTITNEDGSVYGEATFSIENYIAGVGTGSQAAVSEELAKFAMSAYNYFR